MDVVLQHPKGEGVASEEETNNSSKKRGLPGTVLDSSFKKE